MKTCDTCIYSVEHKLMFGADKFCLFLDNRPIKEAYVKCKGNEYRTDKHLVSCWRCVYSRIGSRYEPSRCLKFNQDLQVCRNREDLCGDKPKEFRLHPELENEEYWITSERRKSRRFQFSPLVMYILFLFCLIILGVILI